MPDLLEDQVIDYPGECAADGHNKSYGTAHAKGHIDPAGKRPNRDKYPETWSIPDC